MSSSDDDERLPIKNGFPFRLDFHIPDGRLVLTRAQEWQRCSSCQMPLLEYEPVATPAGYLFCKDCLVDHIEEWRRQTMPSYYLKEYLAPKLDSVNKMTDFKKLKIVKNPSLDDNELNDLDEMAYFVCPVTGLETDGTNKFVMSWNCGCVVSERALKDENQNDKKCLMCKTPYLEFDIVYLNPDKEDIDHNTSAHLMRLMKPELEKMGLWNPSQASKAGNSRRVHRAGGSRGGRARGSGSPKPSTSRGLPTDSDEETGAFDFDGRQWFSDSDDDCKPSSTSQTKKQKL